MNGKKVVNEVAEFVAQTSYLLFFLFSLTICLIEYGDGRWF